MSLGTKDIFFGALPAAPAGRKNVTFQGDTVTEAASAWAQNVGGIDARTTTTETIAAASSGKLVTLTNASAIAIALDSTVPTDFLCWAKMTGAGAGTFTPTAGATINGAANFPLAAGQNCLLFWTGVTWWALTGGSGSAFYQTMQQAGTSKPQEAKLNFLAPITVTDNPGNGSSDVAVPNFVGDSGTGGTKGLVPAPAAGDGAAGKVLKADGSWSTAASGFTAGGDLGGTSTLQEVLGILNTLFDSPGTAWADGQTVQFSSSLGKLIRLVDRPIFPVSAISGKPTAGQLVCIYTAGAAMTFPANFATPDSCASLGVNPTATATYSVYKNTSTLVGTITVSSAGVFTFATTGGAPFSLNARDRLTIVAPGSQDATLSDVGITLVGTRSATVPATAVPPIFTWRGTYAGGTTYNPFDVVAFSVSSKVQSYVCIAPTTGNAPTNTSFWSLLAQAGADGTSGSTTAAQVQQEAFVYSADTGAANAYVIAQSPSPTLVAGSIAVWKAANANSGASTLNADGTARAIKKSGSTALASGDINSNQIYCTVFDGTNWQLIGGSGGGGNLTAKYVIGDFDGTLTNSVKNSTVYMGVDVCPASPNTMNDEFDDTSGNSGTGNGLNARWAWFNQGSAVISYQNSSAVIDCVSNGTTDILRFIGQVMPSAPWEFEAKLHFHEPASGAWGSNYHFPGMALWETATSKFLSFGAQVNGGWGIRLRGNASEPLDLSFNYGGGPLYIKINRTSSTLSFYFSGDGLVFNLLGTRTITNDFTTAPDRIGIGVNPYSQRSAISCDHFRRII